METKNKGGRPRKYETPEQMQAIISQYFTDADPYTVEGLCLALDIDRSTLLDYENKYTEFSHTIKRAKLQVQQNVVQRGLSGKSNPTVTIFVLKNCFGYEDRTISEVKEERIIRGMSADQIAEILSDESASTVQ